MREWPIYLSPRILSSDFIHTRCLIHPFSTLSFERLLIFGTESERCQPTLTPPHFSTYLARVRKDAGCIAGIQH